VTELPGHVGAGYDVNVRAPCSKDYLLYIVLLEYYLSADIPIEEVAELPGHVDAGYDVDVRAQPVAWTIYCI
jgi:hypothetical protein